MTWKETIDDFIKIHYDDLDRICKANSKNKSWNSNDLLNELIIYLYSKENKVKEYISHSNSMIRFCSTWCYNQVNIYKANKKGSNFRGKYDLSGTGETPDIFDNLDNFSNPILDEDEIDLLRVYSSKQTSQILFVKRFYHRLNESDKHLYKLHFEDGLSHYKIAEYLKDKYNMRISNSSVYNMLVKLRKKIKENYDNNHY